MYFLTGKIKEIDEVNCTCVFSPDNGDADFYDVRLRSQINEIDLGMVIFPKINSNITIGFYDYENSCVLGYTEIDKISFKGDNLDCVLNIENTGGVTLNVLNGKVEANMTDSGFSISAQQKIEMLSQTAKIETTGSCQIQSSSVDINATTVDIDANAGLNIRSASGFVNLQNTGGAVGITAGGGLSLAGSSIAIIPGGGSGVLTLGQNTEGMARPHKIAEKINVLVEKINEIINKYNMHLHTGNNLPVAVVQQVVGTLNSISQNEIDNPLIRQ